ncbi:zf-DNL-domain-containing protein, partial [Tothia fuscella]
TEPPKPEAPAYDLTFTCKKCDNRSTHKVSKQGYHNGTVLITCPGCKNRHLIADHLKIFSDKRITLEDIMKEKGQVFRKGGLLPSGDVEFWDTGEVVTREPPG